MALPVRTIWEDILNRFQNYDRIVAREWRAERAESPAHAIIRLLKRPIKNHPKVLLSGTVGTGKSTELQRIAEEEAKDGSNFVIFLDLASHFHRVVGDIQALQQVSSWEVCFLSGLALLRAAKETLGYDFPPDQIAQLANAWTNIAKASQESSGALPSIDILSLIKSMTLKASKLLPVAASNMGMPPEAALAIAGGLAGLSEIAGAGKWTLPIGRISTKIL
jgi:hypothetical protein